MIDTAKRYWWVIAIVFVLALGYMTYRKKQSLNNQASSPTNASSNLGTVPISNLTTEAEPMPIQQGDTFVNVTQPGPAGPAGPTGPTGPTGPSGSTGTTTHTLHNIGTYSGATWGIQQGGSPGSFDIFKNGKYFSSGWLKPTAQAVAGTPFTVSGSKLTSGAYKADVNYNVGTKKGFAGVWIL